MSAISRKMEDELWIEQEIARELEAIDDCTLRDDAKFEEDPIDQPSPLTSHEEDLIPSMQEYISKIQSQSAKLQFELEECDEILHHTETARECPETDLELVALAEQEGLSVQQLKQKVLRDIEEEEKAEHCLLITEAAIDTVTDLLSSAQVSAATQDNELDSATFITTIHNDFFGKAQTNNANNSNLSHEKIGGDGDIEEKKLALMLPPSNEATFEIVNGSPSCEQPLFATLSGKGVVALVSDSELLEKQLLKEMIEAEQRLKAQQEQRIKEIVENRVEREGREHIHQSKRQRNQQQLKQEQEVLTKQKEEREVCLTAEANLRQKEIELSLVKHEKDIKELSRQADAQKLEFERGIIAVKEHQVQKRTGAATVIQAVYRGYIARKTYGREVQATIERVKEKKYQERVEQAQQKIDTRQQKEKILNEEKEKIDLEERERKQKAEEEKQRKIQEEIARKEEEKKRIAEEKKRKAEEERVRKEAEKARKEEEKSRKEEELRLKKVEEKRIKEEKKKEEEKKRREEEKQKQIEEEKRKKEQLEKLKIELEKQKLLEVQKIEEELRKHTEQQFPIASIGETAKQSTEILISNGVNRSDEIIIADKIAAADDSVHNNHSEITKGIESQLHNSPNSMTPRPPTSKKPEVNYERPISGKKRSIVGSDVSDKSVTVINGVDTRKSIQSQHELAKSSKWGEFLPKPIDDARLNWIGNQCKSLSKIVNASKSKKVAASKKPLRRPSSAKTLAPLDEQLILTAANLHSLKSVTTVELSDLPGCSLNTLSQCVQLKYLTMINCCLVTTDGLENAKYLSYVDLHENRLEAVSFKDLQLLVYVDLSHNSLTSMHGLESTAIRYLNLAHNKITRISGLACVKHLHSLDLSHNQLITTLGLGDTHSLQYLDVSHNHLQSVDDLEDLALLQTLLVNGNNLMQVPKLTNQVLLHKLVLSDNSISFLSGLTQTWLPLLSHLNLSQNSISMLDPMLNLLLLEHLDISNNQLLDTDQLMPALQATRFLLSLHLSANPVCEDPQYSSKILNVLPFIEKLNDEPVSRAVSETLDRRQFEKMCLTQTLQIHQLYRNYQAALRKCSNVDEKGNS